MNMVINTHRLNKIDEMHTALKQSHDDYDTEIRAMLEEFLKNNNLDKKVIQKADSKIGKLCVVKTNRFSNKASYIFEFRMYNKDGNLIPRFCDTMYVGTDFAKYLQRIYERYEPYIE